MPFNLSNFNYKYSICQKNKFTLPQCNHMIYLSLCVFRFDICFTYVISTLESKLISLCLIVDYSLITNLHIFVYERAELSSISVDSTNTKFAILNNFAFNYLL